MVLDLIFQIWRRLNASVQWRLLWLFNNKFLVSVAGIVYDRDDRILLQRHRHWVTDAWGLPGGIVESGESLENAFSREVLEETGLDISNVELISLVSGYRLRMEAYFRAKLLETADEQIIKLQEEEIIEAHFYSLDTLPSNILQIHKDLILQEKVLRPQEVPKEFDSASQHSEFATPDRRLRTEDRGQRTAQPDGVGPLPEE